MWYCNDDTSLIRSGHGCLFSRETKPSDVRIRSKDTKPEKIIRSILHKLGFRFRINRKDLPGKPDIVLPKCKTVIFVHGCFWHQHEDCKYAVMPKSNTNYWKPKLTKNMDRDKLNIKRLNEIGWNVLTIWECQIPTITKSPQIIEEKIKKGIY